MPATTAPRRFVPADLDVARWQQLEPLYQQLLERPIGSAADLLRWIQDLSELSAVVDEYGARRYIDKSCHTDDPDIEKAFLHFVENIEPRIKPLFFRLQKRLVESPLRNQLGGQFATLLRRWQADVEIFRDENVPLETQITQLTTDYDKICGAMTVHFDGRERTLQQMSRYLEKPDRNLRQQAWELVAQRRLADRQPIESIFQRLLDLRHQIAANAGFSDYRAYMWKSLKRFDYSPEDCLRFADAIERVCMPLVRELDRQRMADLGLDTLRPWDTAVDPKNRPPLEPFAEDDIGGFIDKTRAVLQRISPQLAEQFDSLRAHGNLDLASRKNKQPGGYQSSLEESRQPFIFMNAAGMQRDVETLLHEAGHAFHHLAACRHDIIFLRHAPMEFCEVASMSMELLGADHFDLFYDPADAARARRGLLEGIVRLFPWVATIDGFQHWLYTHPGHAPDRRAQQWLALLDRFGGLVDWTGLEEIRRSSWQRQLHLFHVPFYYIEYGIAQLGALQVWLKSRTDPHHALAHYRAALALGGTRPLPQLFSAAGIHFDFSEKTLAPLIAAVGEELSRLPR